MLWERRNAYIKLNKSHPWNTFHVDEVVKRLKFNKTRDPHGYLNELFKPGYIGNDLKFALLSLFNEMKRCQEVPDFLCWSNITTLYKSKGSREDMNND